ncbi:tRNA 2-thiouridine(34) synthase MnmA [Mesomycoplasma flocculare]|uniref:tRNA 2-thiouridine(34) synthase MnmA n=1 Tax=Mesomycoplasma flocculare TaxID=2128 RepID=UPI00136DB480|nr:tRNA 2-thiouridine(34) synthase MnmA [Mesomycoplasma flocculare]MXR05979.1 tRNA 2-thiouridine(34) synthase MnmA [Mesomycoplasma flocculare]MXR12346.1 tRNA 2-thiouridine(34) synthase MnmA [Mesomycoplasma flocculare]MXR39525.1 tRNA 2-thiouridine(34) synthase MnmA [Mycoplasma sp. MF12]
MAKIVLGFSGGVDSAVAAYLLKKAGHELIAVFMRNWDSNLNNDFLGQKNIKNFNICPQEQDWLDAKTVATQLGISIFRVDFIKEYWDEVFIDFIAKYQQGLTPNPDILCNKNIKFKHFLNYAVKVHNADFIAMGHYAKSINGNLYAGIDKAKDQSYFLAQLSKAQLRKTIFPLGFYKKTTIRKIATKIGLINAEKKDSTGICFIGERKFTDFLQNYIPAQPGNIVDISTKKILGKHIGVMYFTIGQRKGFGLNGMNEPYFVVGHNLQEKILYVSAASDKKWLESDELLAYNANFLVKDLEKLSNLSAKFRYRQEAIPVTVKIIDENSFRVYYQNYPAITPGQQVVIYYENQVVLAGEIRFLYRRGEKLDYLD